MSPEEWYKTLPPITKVYWSAAVLTTILSTLGVLNVAHLYLSADLVKSNFHLWRLVTNFFFFGKFSMPFVFQVVLLVRYFGLLEAKFSPRLNATADMLMMLLFGVLAIILLDFFLLPPQYFYGSSIVFMVVYVWSRTDPFAEVMFYGFSWKQWHTPFLFLVAGMLFGANSMLDLLGIAIGHTYFFLTDIVPRNWAVNLFWTPDWMIKAVKAIDQRVNGAPASAAADSAAPRPNWQHGQGHRLG